jgi:hypothetical protein
MACARRSTAIALLATALMVCAAAQAEPARHDPFTPPSRGFASGEPAPNWQNGLLTGSGTMGAVVMGAPFDETIHLTHAALYLPRPTSPHYIDMAARLPEIRRLCLGGDYAAAGKLIDVVRKDYPDERDPFLCAFDLRVKQQGDAGKVASYRRGVDFMTGEASVDVASGERARVRRSVFVSRADDVIVMRISGSVPRWAQISFEPLPPRNEKDERFIAEMIKSSAHGVRDGLLYFRTEFAHQNPFNPNRGYEGLGKVIVTGGERSDGEKAIAVRDAKDVLVLVKIRPLEKADRQATNVPAMRKELDALPTNYEALLARHARIHGDLMGRVSLSLDAPAADRAKASEDLIRESAVENQPPPLAMIERAFDAGRYNIICSTGLNPPNLQGIWSGTWQPPWMGSFTVNGNLPCAISFQLDGNTPELMQPYFAFYERMLPGFRENAKALFGTRGIHVPAQMTTSPRETDFSAQYPHCYWHSGAAWACHFFYDYYLHTGDERFLAERAYPLMKETAAFYEEFLTVTDKDGRLAFVPSYSPENSPRDEKQPPTSINATMDIICARELLTNAIATAKHLHRDADLQAKWAAILSKLPDYQVAPDGSLREWLWPGLEENNQHRHASQLYALYYGRPPDIVDRPELVAAARHTIRQRLNFHKTNPKMAFGVVQLGLAAAHLGDADTTQEAINFLANGYWSTGMASLHNRGNIFNMDLSGGFPSMCAAALVYADPGEVRLLPAKPPRWKSGSLKGVRLRGGIVVRDLTWDEMRLSAELVSDRDQAVTVISPAGERQTLQLRGNESQRASFSATRP